MTKKIIENCYLFIDSMNFSKTIKTKFKQDIDFDLSRFQTFFFKHNCQISRVFVYSTSSNNIPKSYEKKLPDGLLFEEYIKKKNDLNNFQFSIENKGCILKHEDTILNWNVDKGDWEEKGVDTLLSVDAIRLANEYENMILCTHDSDYRPMMHYIKNELKKYTVLCTVYSGIQLNEDRYRTKCISVDETFPFYKSIDKKIH